MVTPPSLSRAQKLVLSSSHGLCGHFSPMTIETPKKTPTLPPKNPTRAHDLGHDVLRTIFTLNADMFAPDLNKDAFKTTVRCSHVCREWRDVIVHDGLMWSRLVDLDVLLHVELEGVQEVLRRTNGFPLQVKAGEVSASSVKLAVQALDYLWERIEKLVVGKLQLEQLWANAEEVDWDSDVRSRFRLKKLWKVFSRPAPLLKHFDVDLHWVQGPAWEEAFFGGHAPLLEHFSTGHCIYEVRGDAAWFQHLSSVLFTFSTMTLGHIVDVLKLLPRLECLSIEDDLRSYPTHQRWKKKESIHRKALLKAEGCLSGLKNFHLTAGVGNLAFFLAHFPVPLTSAFGYTNVPDDSFGEGYEDVMEGVAAFSQRAFAHSPPKGLVLRWDVAQYELWFGCEPREGLKSTKQWPPVAFRYLPPFGAARCEMHILLPRLRPDSGVLGYLNRECLENITSFKFYLDHPLPDFSSLVALENVKTIEADLRSLNLLAESLLESVGVDEDDQRAFAGLLPNLQVIRVTGDAPKLGFKADALVALLQTRYRLGVPVRTLDVSRVDGSSTRLQHFAALFQTVPGLEISDGEQARGYHQVYLPVF